MNLSSNQSRRQRLRRAERKLKEAQRLLARAQRRVASWTRKVADLRYENERAVQNPLWPEEEPAPKE